MSDAAVHRGGCLCGRVRFSARGGPRRVSLCHCLDCRKAHGAPVVAFAVFAEGRVELGEGDLGSTTTERGYARFFCRACGGRVWARFAGSDEVELPLGSFDETNLFAPSYETWAMRRESWLFGLPGVLESHARNAPGEA